MAAELPPEQRASYSAIIDRILHTSDMTTVSSKTIRKGLQAEVDYDLNPQKDAIKALIMERFDKVQREHEENGTAAGPPEPAPTANGVASRAGKHTSAPSSSYDSASPAKRKVEPESDDLSDVADPPAKKARKSRPEAVESDEQLAKRMQAELNAAGARATRGGGAKRKPVVKKTAVKRKSKAKVGSDEDSDVDSADKPEREKKGGFHKLMTLSEPLSAMLNETALSRPQTVKRIWAYIKANDLQNPNDKREIMCDDTMRAVFKQDKVHMFTMNKFLAGHLYAQDE